MTPEQHAEDAWRRHLMRNRSVLVDLFQGLIKNEVRPRHGRGGGGQ